MNSAAFKPPTANLTGKSAAIKSVGVASAISKHSFVPFNDSNVHEHDHRLTPHVHSFECDRYASGNDQNRHNRFYFTRQTTPVRVYLNYNEKLLTSIDEQIKSDGSQVQFNAQLNGRKLSPRTLRNQLRLSQKFIEDAKNLIFLNESLSLVPPQASIPVQSSNLPMPLTMAEMAVLPLHTPATSSAITTSKTKVTSRN